jgi:YhcH/YjgK/YiaL family protein
MCNTIIHENPSGWEDPEVNNWFINREWAQGWERLPDHSLNSRKLAEQYYLAPKRWQTAFNLLKTCVFSNLEPGRYEVDGSNLYFVINHYFPQEKEQVRFEAHHDYIDIQYVFEGEEYMGLGLIENSTEMIAYDPEKDIAFFEVSDPVYNKATTERFFIFFPGELHQPGVKTDQNQMVKKIVIKVKKE